MRAQIFHLLESGNLKGHLRSLPPTIDNEILARQGVVTFNSIEELYEQYMKTLVDIRETDKFIIELEETHSKEITEITQREYILKENFEQLREKLDQTRTDLHIQSLAKQVLDREHHHNIPKVQTTTINIQTDMNLYDLKLVDDNLKRLQRICDEKDMEFNRIMDEMK
jgi:ATP-dependent Lon protease